ncbi:MAG: murein biosynthesis integral membrane protein MurJ [Acidobacteria bacterium]|nr:murein biosynthesis integral membrane protein MurJ [Acidobacteriota bacterium]
MATLASRVLGLVRDQMLAALFGAGNDMDAFIVAFRIPNLVRDLFAEGAMSAAFVPTFTRQLTRGGKPDAWRLGNNVLNALLIVTGALVVLGTVFAQPLVRMYAGDFASVPGKLELTVRLTRVTLPFLTMVAIAAAVMGMLNSLHHYFLPALSPAMFNLATIVLGLALVPVMPAIGFPRLGQIALQWPSLRREGFRYAPVFEPRDAGLRQVLILMGPGAVGLAATQVNIFVNTLLATSQGTGAVSWLTYAFRLMYLPIGLFGVSIGTAVLPAASRHAAVGDTIGVRDTVSRGLAMMLMLNLPATLGLIALATPIVQLLFQRGHFAAADTAATAAALRLYAVGLVGYSTVRIVSPAFYAIGRSRVPVMVSACAIGANVIASVALVKLMGFRGLALGTSIAAIVNAAALVWLLQRHLGGVNVRRLGVTVVKIAVSALVMAAMAAWLQNAMMRAVPGQPFTAQALRLAVSIGGALAGLGVTARVLHVDEFADLLSTVQSRLVRDRT